MNIRINNINIKKNNLDNRFSCFFYYKNDRYGKLDEMLKDGWEDFDTHIMKNGCTISKNLFIIEELCYVFAYLILDTREGDVSVESVGSRLLNLKDEDKKDFFDAYRWIYKQMLVNNKTDEN